jgi:hypothetical protein
MFASIRLLLIMKICFLTDFMGFLAEIVFFGNLQTKTIRFVLTVNECREIERAKKRFFQMLYFCIFFVNRMYHL